MDHHEIKKAIPIQEVAKKLQVKLVSGNRISCYNKDDHKNGDRHPSLVLLPRINSYRCMGCGVWGSNIDLVTHYHGGNFGSSIDWIKEHFPEAGRDQRRGLLHAIEAAKNWSPEAESFDNPYEEFVDYCGPLWGDGEKYLVGDRGLDPEVLERFGVTFFTETPFSMREMLTRIRDSYKIKSFLGFQGVPFVVYPYRHKGELVCLQGRRLDNKDPRFINTGGDIPVPWNIDATEDLEDGAEIFITEGVIDSLSLMSGGIPVSIAVPSASTFKDEWVFDLARFSCVVCTDNDFMGGVARDLICAYLQRQGAEVKVATLPGGTKDANALLQSS